MILSVIIPVYKVEHFIADCLQSVMHQTYDRFECILIDDHSPDRSMDIVEQLIDEYQGNISFQLLHHQENQGISSTRNTGLSVAQGDYVTFIDSDDIISPDFVASFVELAQLHPGVDIIQSNFKDESHSIFSTDDLPAYIDNPHDIFLNYLHYHITWMVHAKFVRKQFLTDNALQFSRDIVIHEDLYWTYLVCQKAQTLASTNKKVYIYRNVNPESIMHQSANNFERSAHFYLMIIDRLRKQIREDCFTDNHFFLLNFFFYVTEEIRKSSDISQRTLCTTKCLRSDFLHQALHEGKFFEFIYILHLYNPFCHLLDYRFYRQKVIYMLERLSRWHYRHLPDYF